MTEFSFIQLEPLGVRSSLAWLSVDDKHAWDLRQFCKDDLILILDAAHDTIGEQVAVAFVILTLVQS